MKCLHIIIKFYEATYFMNSTYYYFCNKKKNTLKMKMANIRENIIANLLQQNYLSNIN